MSHIFRKALQVGGELVPHRLHDMLAASQLGERRVGVVEAVQQHFGNLPLLYPHQPCLIVIVVSESERTCLLELLPIF